MKLRFGSECVCPSTSNRHTWKRTQNQNETIRKRGFAEVVNRFGGNCFGCHVKAHPEWDMICETTHGCDPIPLTSAMLKALQDTDPRCAGSETVSAADAAALKALADLQRHPPPK